MFTGLIQSLGHFYRQGSSRVEVVCLEPRHALLRDMALGDSIAVDGICLTVETLTPQGFGASVSPETLARSTLGQLPQGGRVNLESSLRAGGKVGGHFVTGHVDGLGVLEQVRATAQAWDLRFSLADRRVAPYLVAKGSIAVNGVSLTVADCDPEGAWFTVAVIPVTYRDTTLQDLEPGQPVNLEGDVLAKYVEGLLRHRQGPEAPSLSLEFLVQHGYQ
jgi:riboflavin synthase